MEQQFPPVPVVQPVLHPLAPRYPASRATMMLTPPGDLPPIQLIPVDSGSSSRPKPLSDLRWSQVDEFFRVRSLAPNTQKAYRYELKRFLSWTRLTWAEITPTQVNQFKAHLLQQGLAPGSVNRALTALMSFFDWFRSAYPESMRQNLRTATRLEQAVPSPIEGLSPADMDAIQAALSSRGETAARDRALFAVLRHGLRAEEAIALNVENYDGKQLIIHNSKTGRTEMLPLDQQTRNDLDLYLVNRAQQEGELIPDSPLFLSQGRNRSQRRLGYQGLYYTVKEVGRLAGIKNLTPSQLRRNS